MRDFRDAKAMAYTLRAALATKGSRVTNSESLELIAHAFGVADWNTLSAAIREEAVGRNNATTLSRPSTIQSGPPLSVYPSDESGPAFSTELSSTLDRALASANYRKHEYTTLEHLLLALTDDADALAVLTACKVDLGTLKEHLTDYIDSDLKRIVIDDGGGETQPTAAFGRVIRCAEGFALGRGRPTLTGAEVLVPIFFEKLSPAARFLSRQGMTRQDAVNFIIHGIRKGRGETAS